MFTGRRLVSAYRSLILERGNSLLIIFSNYFKLAITIVTYCIFHCTGLVATWTKFTHNLACNEIEGISPNATYPWGLNPHFGSKVFPGWGRGEHCLGSWASLLDLRCGKSTWSAAQASLLPDLAVPSSPDITDTLCFYIQLSGGRGRQVAEFEASVAYRASSRRARAT